VASITSPGSFGSNKLYPSQNCQSIGDEIWSFVFQWASSGPVTISPEVWTQF
jgi:hypothetical protein